MLQGQALTWRNNLVQARGRASAMALPWEDLKKLLMEEYCPDNVVQKLKDEFWNHAMIGPDVDNELKLEDIPVARDFPGVFPEDLSGLPPSHEVEFRIDLILGAMPVAKSPYRLAPIKKQELSNQVKGLQEKGFI
ncbi:hypothetical protein Tco_1553923 [Tanacetum coccineum]